MLVIIFILLCVLRFLNAHKCVRKHVFVKSFFIINYIQKKTQGFCVLQREAKNWISIYQNSLRFFPISTKVGVKIERTSLVALYITHKFEPEIELLLHINDGSSWAIRNLLICKPTRASIWPKDLHCSY